jgi:hypothetical protein
VRGTGVADVCYLPKENPTVKKTVLSTLVVALLLGAVRAPAQEVQPLVVVSFPSVQEVLKDIDYLGSLGGQQNLGQAIEGAMLIFAGGLRGVDRSKPCGLAVGFDGSDFPAVAFVPVTDFGQVIALVEQFTGEKARDGGNGVREISFGSNVFYARSQNGWAYIARDAQHLQRFTGDPLKLLGDLAKQYDIAASVHVQSIPEPFRQLALAGLEQGVRDSLRQEEGESDEAFQQRKQLVEEQVQQLRTLLDELDQITLGLSIDRDQRKAFLDLSLTAKPDGDLAAEFATWSELTCSVAGFDMRGAIASLILAGKLSEQDKQAGPEAMQIAKQQLAATLEAQRGMTRAQRRVLEQLLGALMDEWAAAIETGTLQQVDVGAAAVAQDGKLVLAAALTVGNDRSLEEKVLKALNEARGAATRFQVQRNAANVGGVRLHHVRYPLDDADENFRKLFGNAPVATLGFGNGLAYMAFGEKTTEVLSTIILESRSRNADKFGPLQVTISASELLRLAADLEPDNPMIRNLLLSVQGAENDRVRLLGNAIPNGMRIRLEAEESVLKLVGEAVRMMRPAAGALPQF